MTCIHIEICDVCGNRATGPVQPFTDEQLAVSFAVGPCCMGKPYRPGDLATPPAVLVMDSRRVDEGGRRCGACGGRGHNRRSCTKGRSTPEELRP